MLLQLIRHQEKYQKQVEALQELLIMMQWGLKQDLLTVLKDKFRKENKLYILSLYIKLMLLILDRKDF